MTGAAPHAPDAPVGLHVEEHGPDDGSLVVLVHGSMDRSSGLAKAARRLEHDHRVLRYDRRGYARSRHVGGPFGIEEQVADLVGLLRERRAVFVGHSYGGDVVLATADRHPHLVAAVASFEAPMSWEPWWPSGTAGGAAVARGATGDDEASGDAAEAFLRRLVGDALWDRLPARTKVERRAEGRALVGELADLRAAAPYDPARVVAPTVFGRGERCAPHHLHAAEVLRQRFPAAEHVVLVGATHGAHLSHPDDFAAFVRGAVRASGR